MKCPNCKKKVGYGYRNCPNCNYNLSFSTKVRTGKDTENIRDVYAVSNSLKIGLIIGAVVTMVALLLFVYFFSFMGYFNGTFALIHKILKWMLISGIILLVVCILCFILKKRFKLLKYIWILAIILTCVPILSMKLVNINGDISLKDYSKVKYIEIGEEKIPSLYSVVGKRNIVLSDEEQDSYDEGFEITTDVIMILYESLSTDDKTKYGEALVEYGFSLETVYNTEEEKDMNFYMKNNTSDNTFYIVSMDGLSIVYTKADGRYQDVLDIN